MGVCETQGRLRSCDTSAGHQQGPRHAIFSRGASERRPLAHSRLVNGISSAHRTFLNAGGLGILVGDGMLPNPGLEQIIETYYSLPVSFWRLTFDYQFIVNQAYNRDRGPASVIGTRARTPSSVHHAADESA
jgi:hypothetical protein